MTVCQICGDTGYSQALIHCVGCQIIAAHRYCVDGSTSYDDDNINWSCEDCSPRITVVGLLCMKKFEEEAHKTARKILIKNRCLSITENPIRELTASVDGTTKPSLKVRKGTTRSKQFAEKPIGELTKVLTSTSKSSLKVKNGTDRSKQVLEKPIGEWTKAVSSSAKSSVKVKSGTARSEQLVLEENNGVLLCGDSDGSEIRASATVKGSTAKKKSKKKKCLPIAENPIGTLKEIVQGITSTSVSDLEVKKGTSKINQVKLNRNRSPLRTGDDDIKIWPSATLKESVSCFVPQHEDNCCQSPNENEEDTQYMLQDWSHPRQLKQSSDAGNDYLDVISRGNKTKDLNSDYGVKQGSSEAIHIATQKKRELNFTDDIDDQNVNLGSNVGLLPANEEDPVRQSTSSTGENIHGDSGKREKLVGPRSSKMDDNLGRSTLKPEESIDGVSNVYEGLKHEQLSNEIQSKLEEQLTSCKDVAQAANQADCADNKISEVLEETITNFVLEQQDDVHSQFDSFKCQRPKKRRRLIIEMEYSDDEEQVFVVANHPPPASDDREDPLLVSNLDDHCLARRSCVKSVVPQPSSNMVDGPVHALESPRVVINHAPPYPLPVKLDYQIVVHPLINAAWRGHCNVNEGEYPASVELEAHLSNCADARVQGAASALPESLNFDFVSKKNAWPKSFERLPPTGDVIGLYFFPVGERDERVYGYLIDRMVEHDLLLRSYINNLELLVFCSRELPEEYRCIQRNYYLWGVFKPRKELIMPNKPSDMHTGNLRLPTECSSDSTYHKKDLGTSHTTCYTESLPRIDYKANCSLINTPDSRIHSESAYQSVELPRVPDLNPRDQTYDNGRQRHSSHREHSPVGDPSNRKYRNQRPRKPWRSQGRDNSRRYSKLPYHTKEQHHNDGEHKSKQRYPYDSKHKSRQHGHWRRR